MRRQLAKGLRTVNTPSTCSERERIQFTPIARSDPCGGSSIGLRAAAIGQLSLDWIVGLPFGSTRCVSKGGKSIPSLCCDQ